MMGAQMQKAIYLALTAAKVCDGRIYDRVPEKPVFPYVTIGNEQVIDDGNFCDDGFEVFSDIHVWSRPASGSKIEVKSIMADVYSAIIGIAIVADFRLISMQLETSRTMRDPDGLTEHGVMTFKSLVDPA